MVVLGWLLHAVGARCITVAGVGMSSGSGRRGRAVCVVPVDVMVRQLIPSIRQGLKALPDARQASSLASSVS